MANKLVDSYLVYQLVSRLIKPFAQWDAFRLGIIDKDGNVIKHRKDLTPQEEETWGYFDILVANIKKMIGKLPGGKTRLANFAAAVFLMKEHKQYSEDQIDQLVEACEKHLTSLQEDMGAVAINNVGQGSIASVGVGPNGEPPGKLAVMKKARMLTRKKLNVGSKIST
jgi:hypothetical protein